MGNQPVSLTGPDLSQGVEFSQLTESAPLVGHCQGEPVLLVRKGDACFAVGASCTHYGAPLSEGIVSGQTIRCPWHHAAFDLGTGEAVKAPALNPIACWKVERNGSRVRVVEKKTPPAVASRGSETIGIIGAGASGSAAAEMLRRRGHQGTIFLCGSDEAGPVDRPNLSKDYLAGNAPEEWIPLRPPEFYREARIELQTGVKALSIDVKKKTVTFSNGQSRAYDKLLLATGADPIRLSLPGSELPHVHYLRTLGDCRAIIGGLPKAKSAVVVGASFIGLEVAASLRARGLTVQVVGKESRPLERVLGPELGDFLRSVHEEKGVRFFLGRAPVAIDAHEVTLDDGSKLAADLVVIGVGVKPNVELAEKAGLAVDRGILVDEYLQTSQPGIFAAGDAARWLDSRTREKLRVEHWVVAQRQGQTAAKNMLGLREKYQDVPFFWSNHYDVAIGYVGYGHRPIERREVIGKPSERNCAVLFWAEGKVAAVATIGRERASLLVEQAMECNDFEKVRSLLY